MKRTSIIALAALLVAGACNTARAECIVADPSPTPLNIRTAPHGRIVTTIGNGIEVDILDHAQGWVFVGIGNFPLGWVYRDYIVCKGER
jgi:hypothetical protein